MLRITLICFELAELRRTVLNRLELQYAEVLVGPRDGLGWKEVLETGAWPLTLEAVIDAKSVFDNVTNVDLRIPSEQSLVVVLLALREVLKKGDMKRLWWCVTEDMVSDALTKGAVSREQIIALFRLGNWISN